MYFSTITSTWAKSTLNKHGMDFGTRVFSAGLKVIGCFSGQILYTLALNPFKVEFLITHQSEFITLNKWGVWGVLTTKIFKTEYSKTKIGIC